MGETEDQALTVHTRRYRKKKDNHQHKKGMTTITKDKINSEEILPTFDATLVMRRGITPDIFLET